MFTATLNGSLGKSTSSYARTVMSMIGTASGECQFTYEETLVIRKNSLEIPKPPDTVLPINLVFPFSTCYFLFIRTVNSANLSLTYTPGVGPAQVLPLQLGASSHPEGLFVLFGEFTGLSLQVTDVSDDRTEIQIVAGGI